MMKLVFYWGPGDLVTKLIRLVTNGPYSHVELQFSNGDRFFSSGHGLFVGSHVKKDHRVYDRWWDTIFLRTTSTQEASAERLALALIGVPFDWRGLVSFLFPYFARKREGSYCSSMVLKILQQSLHLYPGVGLKISPNGLYSLFIKHPDREVTIDVPSD